MKTGKIPESVLKRSVLKQIHTKREEVVLGAGVGEDCAAVKLAEDEVFVISTDPITGTATDIGNLAIHITMNDLASAGAEPIGVMLTILLPEESEEGELKKIGYDINYRKYLKKYNDELDEFAVLIDRDMQTHSESNMLECIKYCRDNGYKCYIANPCSEFWLLMHLADIEVEFGDQLDKIKENKKVSEQHTFVSKEVSDRAHHGKSGINFARKYLPYIDKAVIQAKRFPGDEYELVDSIGCNLWRLIEELKMYGK